MGVAAALADALADVAVAAMRDRLEREILADRRLDTNGRTDARLPNTTNIGFSRLEAEAILLLYDRSICAIPPPGRRVQQRSLEPSHVLRAMKIDEKIAHGAIRFSLSRFTTDRRSGGRWRFCPASSASACVLPVSGM
jgi:cysteine desulfurase